MRVITVVDQKREIAIVLGQRLAFFRILHRDQTILLEIATDEVPQRYRHSVEYAQADHVLLQELQSYKSYIVTQTFILGVDYEIFRCNHVTLVTFLTSLSKAQRSTSPITISTLPRITITSATVCPRQRSSRMVRLIKLGGRTR